jgi:type I restriction-modification system DNA methylase subunit
VADPINKAAREAQYLTIVKQYTPEEFQQFPPLLGLLIDCLEQEPTDVLGVLYHRLELHNEQRGQFFTPYTVSLAMAKMLVHDAKHLVEEQEFIRAQEPGVGSGAMVIALAQALREEGINYQQALHVTAIDLDIIAVHMGALHKQHDSK